jgi:ferrous iron transport protein A
MTRISTLDDLDPGRAAVIVAIAGAGDVSDKLRDVGFAEGDEVEVLGRGWLGGTPLRVRLNRTVIALRRTEAALINVETREG